MLNYKLYGLQVSSQLDADYLGAIEAEVYGAYIAPIVGSTAIEQGSTLEAVVNSLNAKLAWLLLQQRQNKITRAGAKLKLTSESVTTSEWVAISAVSRGINADIFTLCKLCNVEFKQGLINDILGIYFTTNYIYS